jgi:UDP-2,3-diacylglucosamine pyrophosphatase LpxH
VLQAFLARAQAGARIVIVPGNHDEVLRACPGTHFGGIEVVPQATFVAADGRRYLVTHGDQFDAVIVNAKWLAHVGDRAYDAALWLNTWLNRLRGLWGGRYWSLSNWAKQQVKQAVNYISEYEAVLAEEARRGGYDGIICGHIHAANLREVEGLAYVNTGDWVESCTAVAERDDGTLELIDWAAVVRRRQAVTELRAAASRRRRGRPVRQDEKAA